MKPLRFKTKGTIPKHSTSAGRVVSMGAELTFWNHYTCILNLNNYKIDDEWWKSDVKNRLTSTGSLTKSAVGGTI